MYWLDELKNKHHSLPRIWKGITPFNASRAIELGWEAVEEEKPQPAPEDTAERDAAEFSLVSVIFDLAVRYDAVNELSHLDAVSIPSLLDVSSRYGVTAGDLQAAETSILILARHLEAITGLSWADTWDGLKSRFPGYVAELINNKGASDNELENLFFGCFFIFRFDDYWVQP